MLRRLRLALAVTFLAATAASGQSDAGSAEVRPTITFDMSALEAVILDPEPILADPEAFWQENPVYTLIRGWHDGQGLELDLAAWKVKVGTYAAKPAAERTGDTSLVLARQVVDQARDFEDFAVPHVLSLLPSGTGAFCTTVFLVEETRTGGFSVGPRIALDVTNRVNSDVGTLLNTVVHEFFHSGYSRHRLFRTEYTLENPRLDRMLDLLQNEGMATYAGYLARDRYPVNDRKRDYRMLDDPLRVRAIRDAMNDFFAEAASLDDSTCRAHEDEVAYEERGYYVFGAFMARYIDDRLGRGMLRQCVRTGPRSFVSTYNSLADEDMQLHQFPLPATISDSQHLRVACLAEDDQGVRQYRRALLDGHAHLGDHVESDLNLLGYVLLMSDRPDDAVEILRLNTELFPGSGNTFDSLGEALAMIGETAAAIASYERALELDPGNGNARDQLARLRD